MQTTQAGEEMHASKANAKVRGREGGSSVRGIKSGYECRYQEGSLLEEELSLPLV